MCVCATLYVCVCVCACNCVSLGYYIFVLLVMVQATACQGRSVGVFSPPLNTVRVLSILPNVLCRLQLYTCRLKLGGPFTSLCQFPGLCRLSEITPPNNGQQHGLVTRTPTPPFSVSKTIMRTGQPRKPSSNPTSPLFDLGSPSVVTPYASPSPLADTQQGRSIFPPPPSEPASSTSAPQGQYIESPEVTGQDKGGGWGGFVKGE